MYSQIEKKFIINYPTNNNATYTSLLNYSKNLKSPFQRWYRYKEGYSIELVEQLINKYNKNSCGVILDPFLGSGTTILGAKECNLKSIGYEVNPFSAFLAYVKTDKYSKKDLKEFYDKYNFIINDSKKLNKKYELPMLSFSNKVFSLEIEKYIMNIKARIDEYKENIKVKNLLMVGWLSSIEKFSNYKKSGNGLKYRKTKNKIIFTIEQVYNYLNEEYENIYKDIHISKNNNKSIVYNKSSLQMKENIKNGTISGIIFSPPYANCFDYTEIYKLELWFGGFVKDYEDMRKLRKMSLRSHLSSSLSENDDSTSDSVFLKYLLNKLSKKKVWDKKIPLMLNNYFKDMFKIIKDSYDLLEQGGFCSIVVGNSAYGGIVFPTDLILADFAQNIGFKVDKIDVYRYIIPSSQQYNETLINKKYLRESVICLIKM